MITNSFSAIGLAPHDWPLSGPIDLATQDLPHDSAAMEWWYVNSHLTTAEGRSLSLFAAFFRVNTTDEGQAEKQYAHFLSWALVDADGRRFFPETLLDARAPEKAMRELDHGRGPRDERLRRALHEVVSAGRIPGPDRLMSGDAQVPLDRLALDYGGNRFTKRADGSYDLELTHAAGQVGARLRFTIDKPVVRHGDDGVVRGLGGENMFYYFSPRCRVEGAVLLDGAWSDVAQGAGWYDHEFGENREEAKGYDAAVGWNWIAAQLDNGYEISAYDLFDRVDPSKSHGRWAILIGPDGERRAYSDFSFEALDRWTSTKTFNEYPSDRDGEQALEERFRAFDTICSATQDRQDAVLEMLDQGGLDVMVVIGGYNSSNTQALARMCAARVTTFHIDSAACIEGAAIRHRPLGGGEEVATGGWLPGSEVSVGMAAGASTPDSVVGDVIERILALRGRTIADLAADA